MVGRIGGNSMKNPIASKSVCNTLAIVIGDIEYGINDYVKVKYAGIEYQLETSKKWEKRRINYDPDGNAWFTFHGNKEYLNEYIRTEF